MISNNITERVLIISQIAKIQRMLPYPKNGEVRIETVARDGEKILFGLSDGSMCEMPLVDVVKVVRK